MQHTRDSKKLLRIKLIDDEIRFQWSLGSPMVFEKYLYTGMEADLLKSSFAHKAAWLRRITLARKVTSTDV